MDNACNVIGEYTRLIKKIKIKKSLYINTDIILRLTIV